MNYTEKTKRIERIIKEISDESIDPATIISKIEEAKKLINECQEQLTSIEKELNVRE